ncbi:regulator of G-protein signaling 7-like [Penaeus indicus]|uniref:regulator of G-protein signaling 7-like n=1 Tax=Penaeus indicus TaxID=29960 RepID=UPI00300D0222
MDGRHAHAHATAGPKPLVFAKMEALVREMQDPETGVPIRSQKWFLTSIPSSFMGYDLIEWLMERLEIEDSAEAIHLANLLCQYGYFFPVGESRSLIVKDDSSLYRFQLSQTASSSSSCLSNRRDSSVGATRASVTSLDYPSGDNQRPTAGNCVVVIVISFLLAALG